MSDTAAQLAAVVLAADPAGWHRLTWLGQELPLVVGRLKGVAGQAAPGAAAVQALEALQQRIEREQVRGDRGERQRCKLCEGGRPTARCARTS